MLSLKLSELKDEHRSLVGGKAASLGTLMAAGFSVPEGFVLTTEAFARFVAPFAEEIRKVEEQLGSLKMEASAPFLGELRKKFLAAPIPEDVRSALHEGAGALGDAPLAVRSSGTKEDLEGTSFAGQYESVLDVRGRDALDQAVKQCWASVFRTRVLLYAGTRAGGARGLSMAVVVQKLVKAETAGVVFTVNPLTGRERESVIEACFGLGEALVSGKVNADRFVVDQVDRKVLERSVVTAGKPTLDDAALLELAELGARVQESYGRPMDIEWAREGGRFALVQARPITKISFAPDTGEWTTADFRDGGVSSDVCSPFMWSLYESVLEHTLPQYFIDIKLMAQKDKAKTKWTRMFFARPYWNLGEVKRVLEKIPGYDEKAFDEGLGIESPREGVRTPMTILGILKAIPVLLALGKCYKGQLATDKVFHAAFDEKKKPYDRGDLGALDDATFAKMFRALITGFYFETESTYFYTIYNTTNAKQDLRPHLEKAEKAVPGLDTLKLMIGLQDLSHLRPIRDMHERLGKTKTITDEMVKDFAERWRHHGAKELDIRVPRWKDDHAFVRTMLEQSLATHDPGRQPDKQAALQHAEYEKERARAEAALGFFSRGGFKKNLDLVRTYAWWREEMRDLSTYAYFLVRAWAVEAARRLVQRGLLPDADAVWYLTFQEAIAAVEGTLPDAAAKARAGRRMVQSFRSWKNPPEIGERHKDGPKAAPAAGALKGIGCSPGRVQARAKVVRKLEEASKVEKGDVLVTIFTDPGWTPLLGRVAAVVTETGGILSHAAVISREYGIPAVLAVNGATSRIQDGDTVIVDGTHGTVEIPGQAPGAK
jgi:pyruvate,water dikinase